MPDYADLAGRRFPAGTYTLPEYVCWLWSDAAQLPPAYEAHPAVAHVVASYGMSVTVQDILDMMDAAPEGGVTFGEFGVEYHGALRAGATYECDAEVLEVERKRGRRAGVFDKLSFKVTIREKGSEAAVAVCTNAWIFPRANGEP
ncbi:MAG TPA: hypothetical protein VMA96_14600 [Solirubrobacteraceae bacterium]|nr:hypothetical protein [Solirubrobacteraceae bacterium]